MRGMSNVNTQKHLKVGTAGNIFNQGSSSRRDRNPRHNILEAVRGSIPATTKLLNGSVDLTGNHFG
jgi:hypothetical protein